jgi:hypothetical protein
MSLWDCPGRKPPLWWSSALRAHTKAPYKMDFHRETPWALKRPWAARTARQTFLPSSPCCEPCLIDAYCPGVRVSHSVAPPGAARDHDDGLELDRREARLVAVKWRWSHFKRPSPRNVLKDTYDHSCY